MSTDVVEFERSSSVEEGRSTVLAASLVCPEPSDGAEGPLLATVSAISIIKARTEASTAV